MIVKMSGDVSFRFADYLYEHGATGIVDIYDNAVKIARRDFNGHYYFDRSVLCDQIKFDDSESLLHFKLKFCI